jgi:hypothetical protein
VSTRRNPPDVAAGFAAALTYLVGIRLFSVTAGRGVSFPGWLPILIGVVAAAASGWVTFKLRRHHGELFLPDLSTGRSRFIGCLWIAAPISLVALAATLPARNSPPVPASGFLLIIAFFGLLVTAVVGFFAGAAWSLWIATFAGVVGLVVGLTGGISDHDPEPFFAYEVGVFPLLLAVTVALLRRRTRSP